MNFELSMQVSKEKVKNWHSQAEQARHVKAVSPFAFRFPRVPLPRFFFGSRKPA